ncbi:TraB/GumN family protein [Desulfofalx alkaliphila]|uniref:TraB/GumN family protein n=1 Tax=Desulfofalx alkaliphila TaxID=105483 RepID=UPI0004E20560|nr:TraB/GumN family protein [Desulfofalx alkaliphila]
MSEQNITRINLDGKEIIIIGTAHISRQSAEQVKEVIETERPDTVCVELDEQRYQSIKAHDQWKKMDIFKVIKEKKATFLLVNLFLSSTQKRLAKQMDIRAGKELIQGIESANEIGAELVLADRNIQTTFLRIWHSMGFWGKIRLFWEILLGIFSDDEITEEELEQLKTQDMLNAMLSDFSQSFPELKRPLIDERDQYLSQKIKDAPGEKIVAVVGAAHLPGIKKEITKEHDLAALNKIPPKSKTVKIIAWTIPILILSMIGYSFYLNPSLGIDQTVTWVWWNCLCASIGAALALGHPLTIASAALVSPISSLNPLLAAGWFAGIVQAYLRRPTVEDFQNLPEDILSVKGFWRNKATRVLLIVALTNIGSSLGAIIGGANVINLFIKNV